MKNTTRKQLLLIAVGVLVGVLIFLAPDRLSTDVVKENSNDTVNHDHDTESSSDHELRLAVDSLHQVYIDDQLHNLSQFNDTEMQVQTYDTLIAFSIKNNYPPLVAKFSKQKAELMPSATSWMLAGDNYFKAFRLSKNTDGEMISQAIDAYKKVLSFDQQSLEAKTAMGVAYVEGASLLGEMPMKGIGILKEVLDRDPNNIDALTNLGYFSIQSGQYEKAIERFEKILEIDSLNAEAYIYLTDIYLSQNNQEKGIQTLEKYKSLINDPQVIQQVDDYINELKSK